MLPLVLAAVLLARFVTSGGLPILTMMGGSPNDTAHHHAGRDQDRPDGMHHARHHQHGPEHEATFCGGFSTRRFPQLSMALSWFQAV